MGSIRIHVLVCLVVCLLAGASFPQSQVSFESLLASAQQAQARSDFQAAAESYRQAIVLHPEIPELRANLGLMYYELGKDQDAIEAFRQSIRLRPGLFVPNLFLGREYVKQKRFSEAIPYLKRASVLKPADIQAQMGLAHAYTGTGKTRLAIDANLRAQKIDPQDADIWYHLGVSYLEQVEADARVLLAQHKDSPYLQTLAADNFFEQHAFTQAADAYQKALASPKIPRGAQAGYAFTLLNRGDLPGAERELKDELQSTPGSLMAKLGFARLHIEQGQSEEAAKEVKEIWITDGGFLRANASLLTAGLPESKNAEFQHTLEQGQGSENDSELAKLFQSDLNNEPLASQGADFTSGSFSQAKLAPANAAEFSAAGKYRQCSDALGPRFQTLASRELRTLVFCAYSTGDYLHAFDAGTKMALNAETEAEGLYWETRSAQKLAAAALTRASEMASGSPEIHVLLGDIYRERKFFSDAEREYRKALVVQPEDPGASFGLSLTLLATDQIEEAFRVAQAAVKSSPDDPELNAVMGEVLCARHDFTAAEPYLKKSFNTKPEYVPHVHALLGNVYAQTGRTEQAIAELKLALQDDRDGTVHYQLGRLYLKIGNQALAKQAFDISERLRGEALNTATAAIQSGEDEGRSR